MAPKKKPESTRYMIRCKTTDLDAWDERAKSLGFASAGAWLASLGNAEIARAKPAG